MTVLKNTEIQSRWLSACTSHLRSPLAIYFLVLLHGRRMWSSGQILGHSFDHTLLLNGVAILQKAQYMCSFSSRFHVVLTFPLLPSKSHPTWYMWSCWCQEIDCEGRKGDSSPSRLFQKLYFVENRASTTVSNMALWPSFFCITNSLRIPDKQVLTGMLSFLYKIPSSTAQTHLNLQQETQSLVHRQMIFWQECPEENFFLT